MNDAPTGDIKFFSLTSRIGRLRYLAYGIALFLLALVPLILGSMLMMVSGVLGAGVLVATYIAMVVLGVGFAVRRLHDQDRSGWWALLMIVPLANLALLVMLLFLPGTAGDNRFGAPPPPNSTWVIVGAVCYIALIPVCGILAAIAIPAYQDYLARSQMYEGIQLAGGAEAPVAEYMQQNKQPPSDLAALYPAAGQAAPVGKFVATVTGAGSGNTYGVTATMVAEGIPFPIAGHAVELWTTDGGSTWHCGPASSNPVAPRYLPASCRDTDAP